MGRGAWWATVHGVTKSRTQQCLSTTAAAAAAKSLQSCPTLCDPIDGSLPGSPIPGILQARTLEWVAISLSRGSSWPKDWTQVSWVSYNGRQILYHCTTWEALMYVLIYHFLPLKIRQLYRGFPGGTEVKNPPACAGDTRDTGSIPGSGKIP